MARDKGTRERILDVALDLFVDEGYDKASLREIAEHLGITKAALYYHFPSKADILMALHMRMHALADEPLAKLGEAPFTMQRFLEFLYSGIDQLEGNEKLFLLHRNNQSAFQGIHDDKGHEGSHEEMEEKVRKLLADPSFGPAEKLKMVAAFAAAFFTPMAARTLVDIGEGSLAAPLRAIVQSILGAPTSGEARGNSSAASKGRGGARRRPAEQR